METKDFQITIQQLIDNKQQHNLSVEQIESLKQIQKNLQSGNKKKIEKALEVFINLMKLVTLYKFFKEQYFE